MINLDVLKRPLVTEKTSLDMEKGIYTFLVSRDANKISIRQAFEKLFGETVKNIRIVTINKKVRIIGKGKEMEKRANGKKAIITLKGDKRVDVFQSKNKTEKAEAKATLTK